MKKLTESKPYLAVIGALYWLLDNIIGVVAVAALVAMFVGVNTIESGKCLTDYIISLLFIAICGVIGGTAIKIIAYKK